MRLSREQFYDLVELVGKAVSTARQRPVDEAWLDDILPGWVKRLPKPKRRPPSQDEFGLFEGSSWSDDGESERTDLRTVVPGAEDVGFSGPERRKARRNQNEYGDGISCQLWSLQRQVSFGDISVTDGLEQLRELCEQIAGYISPGWARSVRAVIDRCCL